MTKDITIKQFWVSYTVTIDGNIYNVFLQPRSSGERRFDTSSIIVLDDNFEKVRFEKWNELEEIMDDYLNN